MDKPTHPAPPADDEHDDEAAWHALVDGRLAPAQAAALRQRLRGQADAEQAVAHWERQRTQLRALHANLLDAPVPDALLQAARRTADRKARQQSQWMRWGGMAASVVLAFALGWTGHGHWQIRTGTQAHDALPASLAPPVAAQRFVQQAAVAHAVYQPELRHPVEVTAAQQEHLVQWLSKRLDRTLKVPVLAAQGYELVGGRLLPGDSGARAQFMYQNGAGQRITLYLGALDRLQTPRGRSGAGVAATVQAGPGPAARAATPEAASATAFQFTQDGAVPAFYWVDQGFGYALSGQLSRTDLQALATVVYQQLQLP